jgi:hypothetical protein
MYLSNSGLQMALSKFSKNVKRTKIEGGGGRVLLTYRPIDTCMLES